MNSTTAAASTTNSAPVVSGEIADVESCLTDLQRKRPNLTDPATRTETPKVQYYNQVVWTWTEKSWQLPFFARHKRAHNKEDIMTYPMMFIADDAYKGLRVGLDNNGGLILHVAMSGSYPTFLRMTPIELRRMDYALFQTAKRLLQAVALQYETK